MNVIEVTIKVPVPAVIERTILFFVLLYRQVRYGYTFRRIKLTRGKYAIVDVEDFERLNKYKWYCTYYGYARRTVSKGFRTGKRQVEIYMHKVVCPAPDGMIVDHINRNSLDNRKVNLRPATQKQNVWNRKSIRRTGKTRYTGIKWNKKIKKWQVRLVVNGRRESFGYYADETEAAKAYDQVAKKYRGEYAFLNFPEDND